MTNNIEQKVKEENKRLVIISGASRGIGKTFADHYRTKENTEVIGISRSAKNLVNLDLLDETEANNFVNKLNLEKVTDILYIHSMGIDKFEPNGKPHIDYDNDGIDDEVYGGNVTAFLNLVEPLIEKVKQTKIILTLCQIGSVGDIYNVPYWQSFTKSKNIVRKFIKSQTYNQNVKGITLNISSTLDENNRKYGRINADTTYWQTEKELINKSIDYLDGMGLSTANYAEFDFYKHNPNFKPDYFTNLPKLFASWQKDMGFAGKEVPHGIRI